MGTDLHARIAKFESDQHDLRMEIGRLNARILWLELERGVPMSFIEVATAEQMAKERDEYWREIRDCESRAREAYTQALAEAERTQSRRPFDELTRRCHAGEFSPPRPGV
jgi:hypothetical protein